MSPPGAPPAAPGVLEMAEAALAALRGGEPVAAVMVVDVAGAAGAEQAGAVGRRMLVWAERAAGTLGDEALTARAAKRARELLRGTATARTDAVEAAGAVYTLYLEAHRPPPVLVIVGAGHIARPLCTLGALLGFRVLVLDDRPEFATRERFPEAERVLRADFAAPLRDVPLDAATHLVLVTRGHKYDYEVLRDVLRRPVRPAYIGMVGSRRRVRAALEQLAREGIAPERLREVYAPIGLDIGAETPAEIAVAIAAELVRLRRGGSGESLRDRHRVAERWLRPE